MCPYGGSVRAQIVWTNSAGGDWNTGSNWSSQSVPNGASALLPGFSTGSYTVTVGTLSTVNDLQVYETGSLTSNVNAYLNLSNAMLSAASVEVGPGQLASASLTVGGNGTLSITGSLTMGGHGFGTMTQNGGAVNVGGNLSLASVGFTGYYTLNSGTLAVTGAEQIFGGMTANELLQTGGYNTFGSLTVGRVYVLNGGSVSGEPRVSRQA